LQEPKIVLIKPYFLLFVTFFDFDRGNDPRTRASVSNCHGSATLIENKCFLIPNFFLIHSMQRVLLQTRRRRRRRRRRKRSPRSPRKARRGRKTKTQLPEAGQVQDPAAEAAAGAAAAAAAAAATAVAVAAAAVLLGITRRDGRVLFPPQRARSRTFLQCRMDPPRKMKMLQYQSKFYQIFSFFLVRYQ
jgi:hypothetical protein